ncbi:hypothetical protein AARAC_005885 [Aspergillus arachidicola]|uniref:PUA-like domain-containing protein n=1 Tax=Aspergillus arachidicola TaxID=656916 RepID=A0A2G7GAG6_9EURO|nr:hypothetical protein AARAC_005885 [Aspergillus arachidicola]
MAKEKPLTPRTGRNDIFMSIKPEHMHNIATGAKNHEYRRYLLPSSVRRIWFYTSAPLSRIEHVAHISHGKVPGEVPEDGGIGNEDFNAGKKVSKYGYEILDLWKLREAISLKSAISRGFLKGAPQKYCWVPVALLESCPLHSQDHIIAKAPEERPVEKKKQHDPEEPKRASSSPRPRKISDFFTKSDPIN